MGLLNSLSKIFGGGNKNVFSGKNANSSWAYANKFNKMRGGATGGYGAITFANIINADSSVEDIVDEFALDTEDAEYGNCYERAYAEELHEATMEMIAAGDFFGDPEDYIDEDAVEEKAFDYACELAQSWVDGTEWIPGDVLDWAYYDVSSHNG